MQNTFQKAISIFTIGTIAVLTGESAYSQSRKPTAQNKDFMDKIEQARHQQVRKLRAGLPKIINGKPAKPGEFPWIVSLRDTTFGSTALDQHFCGGTIVGDQWVMTAAHCAELIIDGQEFFEVAAGDTDLEAMEKFKLDGVWLHPNYDRFAIDYDFAILKVNRPFSNSSLDIVTKKQNDHIFVGDAAQIAGWGVNKNGNIQRFLLKADVEIISRADCNKPQSYDGQITRRMICAGIPGGGTDTCQGDSGGPISTTSDGKPVLFGVTSWGEGCALPDKYGVYARLVSVRSWIASIIKN